MSDQQGGTDGAQAGREAEQHEPSCEATNEPPKDRGESTFAAEPVAFIPTPTNSSLPRSSRADDGRMPEFKLQANINAGLLSSPPSEDTCGASVVRVESSPLRKVRDARGRNEPYAHTSSIDTDCIDESEDSDLERIMKQHSVIVLESSSHSTSRLDISDDDMFEPDEHDSGYSSGSDQEEDEEQDASEQLDSNGCSSSLASSPEKSDDETNIYEVQPVPIAQSCKRAKWSSAEERLLVHLKEEVRLDWRSIANRLGLSRQSVQMHYLRTQRDRRKSVTEDELLRLYRAIQWDWEQRWDRIAFAMGRQFTADRCLFSALNSTNIGRGIAFAADKSVLRVRDALGYVHSIRSDRLVSSAQLKYLAERDITTPSDIVNLYVAPKSMLRPSDESDDNEVSSESESGGSDDVSGSGEIDDSSESEAL